MKKLISLALTMILIFSTSVTTFATSTTKTVTGGGINLASIDVNGTYESGEESEIVISTDVVWSGMQFTYNEGKKVWDSVNHKEVVIDPSWSDNKGVITVTNHSNTAVRATLNFKATDGVSITGTFTETSGTENDNVLELATAVGTTREEAPNATALFGVSGTVKEDGKLGTITVTIGKMN